MEEKCMEIEKKQTKVDHQIKEEVETNVKLKVCSENFKANLENKNEMVQSFFDTTDGM